MEDKRLISTTTLHDIRPLFNKEVENIARYHQFKSLFAANDAYFIFAEPVIINVAGTQNISWYTDFKGELRTFSSLDAESRKYALGILKNEINNLFRIALKYAEGDAQYKDLLRVIENSIEIPSYDDLYIVYNEQNRTKVVLTRWGFIGAAFNAPTGLIKNLIPIKIKDITIHTVFANGNRAGNINLSLSFLGKNSQLTSNAQGEIVLYDLPFFTKIEAQQIVSKGEAPAPQSFIVTGADEYEIIVVGTIRKFSMKFVTIDKQGKIAPNESIIFEIDGITKEYISDAKGNIEFNDIEEGKKIVAYQISKKNQSNINRNEFICDGSSQYIIHLNESNKYYPAIFKVVNENQQVQPNIPFTFEVYGSILTLQSDANGIIELQDLQDGQEIIAQQSQTNLETQVYKFVFNHEIPSYLLYIAKPKPVFFEPTKILVLDNAGSTVANAQVVIKDNQGKRKYTCDVQGTLVLNDIAYNSNFSVYAEKGRYYNKLSFIRLPDNHLYTINLNRKKCRWWLWLLLLLLLLLAAFLIYKYLTRPRYVPPPPKVEKPVEKPTQKSDATLDCSKPLDFASGDQRGSYKTINMIKSSGYFKLWYNMYDAPDKLIIYCTNDPRKIIYQTRNPQDGTGYVSGQNEVRIFYYCQYITIKIFPQTTNTKWQYKISCSE